MIKIIPRQTPYTQKISSKVMFDLLVKSKINGNNKVKEFEEAFASYVGVSNAIALSSARMGLYLILKYYGVREKDEVILPSLTCPVVPSVVVSLGGVPVFVDSDMETFNIDVKAIEKNITSRTKVIIATHLEGMPCKIDEIIEISKKYNLKVIEDCAQAVGAEYKNIKVGVFGDSAYFSFAYGKQINTMGGGMVVTNNDSLAQQLRNDESIYEKQSNLTLMYKYLLQLLMELFLNKMFFGIFIFPLIFLSNVLNKDIIDLLFEDKGRIGNMNKYKKKYSNLQAVLGLASLTSIDNDNKKRRDNGECLSKKINSNIKRQSGSNNQKSSYCYYSIAVKSRLDVKKKLLNYGIDTQMSWNRSCSSIELFKNYHRNSQIADLLEKQILYIPAHHRLNNDVVEYIASCINKTAVQ